MPRKKSLTPEELAEKGVRKAFADICQTPETPENVIDDVICEVAEALAKEHERERKVQLEDGDSTYELLGQRAGYLVGVQVGLRLRAGTQ